MDNPRRFRQFPQIGRIRRVRFDRHPNRQRRFQVLQSIQEPRIAYHHRTTFTLSRARNAQHRILVGSYHAVECIRDDDYSALTGLEWFFLNSGPRRCQRGVVIQKLYAVAPATLQEAVIASLPPLAVVDHYHVHGWRQVLDVPGQGLYMVGDRFDELVPGHVLVDENNVVRYSPAIHNLTNREAAIILWQLLEGLLYIEARGVPMGPGQQQQVHIKNVVISNGRVQFVVGLTTQFDNRQNVLLAAAGVHENRFQRQRYSLPEEWLQRPFDTNTRNLNACLVLLFQLYTRTYLYETPNSQVDIRYNIFVQPNRVLSPEPGLDLEGIARRTPAAVTSLARRVRTFSMPLLEIFNHVLIQRQWDVRNVYAYLRSVPAPMLFQEAPQPPPPPLPAAELGLPNADRGIQEDDGENELVEVFGQRMFLLQTQKETNREFFF